MKPSMHPLFKYALLVAVACLALAYAKRHWSAATPALAASAPAAGVNLSATVQRPPEAAKTNAPAAASPAASANTSPVTAAKEAAGLNPPSAARGEGGTNTATAASGTPGNPPGTPVLASIPPGDNPAAPAGTNAAKGETGKGPDGDGVTVSFQGAPVDMVVQWLAKTTEKSVIKHPKVQCQLTIISSKKLPARDAINLVYRALAMEGFAAVETRQSIYLVPEGQEPKLTPEVMDGGRADIPEGRQRIVKFFPLKNIAPAELKEKVRGVLSEKATVEVDERANQIVVTDYTDNVRLLAELVKEFDVASVADATIEIFNLKHLEAEELGNLLGLVLNAQTASPASSSRSSSSSSGGSSRMSMDSSSSSSSPSPAPSGGSGGGSASGQQVKIWPDKGSNRLIVTAPKSKIPEIKKLIEILDTAKPQDVAIRVIPLKNVNATDLVREIGPLYQRLGNRGTKDGVEVTANNRSNSLIILSSEVNFTALKKLIASLDTEEAQEKVMQAFPLKNADAEDVAKQLQELNQDQQGGYSRYVYYLSDGPSNRDNKKLSVVADRRRNTVIVQAPPGSMAKIGKMIDTLDQPVTDDSLAPKIFPLKFVSAADLEDVLNELFLKKQQNRSYWYYDDYPSESTDKNVGRLYGKVRITSEPFSNSLIVTANSAEHLAAVEEVIKKLDAPSEQGDTTLKVSLQYGKAMTVANSINILFAKAGSPPLRAATQQQNQPNDQRNPQQQNNTGQYGFTLEQEAKEDVYYPWLGGQQEGSSYYSRGSSDGRSNVRPVSDLVGRVRVVPDRRSNTLLVTCNVHFFPQIMKLVNELDAPTAQVLIGAKIIEVSSDFRDKLGVRWAPTSANASQPNFSGDDLENSLLVNNSASYTKTFVGNSLASSLANGVLSSKLNLDVLIQFLRKNTDATVLAEPQINISDNEMGQLFVGARVPFLTGSMNTDVGGRNDTYNYKDVGVILEVTPRINNAEDVALKIHAESSTLRNGELINGGVVIDTRNFHTDLMLKSGQTAVLGGIINKQHQNIVRKVPVLGSIPGLGWLFKKRDKTTTDMELMVFLSPRITRSPEQAKQLIDDVEKSAPKVKQYQEDQRLLKDAKPEGKTEAKSPAKGAAK